MATENKILDLSFPADEDLSADKYHFVVLTSSGTVRRPNNGTETPIGILQNAPTAGQAANVRLIGVSKLVANAVLTVGLFVKPEYVGATDAGKGSDATGSEGYARAQVIQAADAEDDLCSVVLTTGRPPGTYGVGEITIVDGKIIIGKTGVGFAATPSGDWTITSAGVATIGLVKITAAKISGAAVTAAKISAAAVTEAKISAANVSQGKLKTITAALSVASNATSLSVSSASFTGGIPILSKLTMAALGASALRVTKFSLTASTAKLSLSGATTHTGAAVATIVVLRA